MSNELTELVLDVREHVRMLGELGVTALSYEPSGEIVKPTTTAVQQQQQVRTAPVPAVEPAIPRAATLEPPAPPRVPGSRLRELPSLSNRKVTPAQAKPATVSTAAVGLSREATIPISAETIPQIRAEIG